MEFPLRSVSSVQEQNEPLRDQFDAPDQNSDTTFVWGIIKCTKTTMRTLINTFLFYKEKYW